MQGKSFLIAILSVFLTSISVSGQTLDRIVAIIGDEVILESEVEAQYAFLIKQQKQADDGTLRCQVIESIIMAKLLLDKARQDSVVVSDDQVNSEIERRIQEALGANFTEKEFSEAFGLSIYEFKSKIRDKVEDELLIDKQRGNVLANANVTPREVEQFFQSINPDSLGYLPSEVELSHIVKIPPFDAESKAQKKEKLAELRKRAVDGGEDFAELAKLYSEGPSGSQGGMLGKFGRNQMVKEFEDVVFSLRKNEVSEVFETEYGYHIVKLHDRTGELVEASHILLVPIRALNGDSIAKAELAEIHELIMADSLTFEQAAIRHSDDQGTKDCGGCISNPRNSELRVPMDVLDPELFFAVDEMKEGTISEPTGYTMPDGTEAFHILYLKKKLPPHTPNLVDDYKKIHAAALQSKQIEVLEKWILSAKKNIYIEIKPTECYNALQNWMN